MTNSNNEYESFLDAWQEVIEVTENISIVDTDNENIDSTQDFARLIKVTTYIDEAIKSIDSELVPLTLWSECKNHSISCKPSVEEAVNTRTEATILTANNQVDILVSTEGYGNLPDCWPCSTYYEEESTVPIEIRGTMTPKSPY